MTAGMKICLNLLLPASVAALLCAVSCVREAAFTNMVEASAEEKIISMSDDFSRSSILVKFNSVPGTDELKTILNEGGVAGIEPLFSRTPGREELEKRFGLDRWYKVSVAEDANIEKHSQESEGWLECKYVMDHSMDYGRHIDEILSTMDFDSYQKDEEADQENSPE